MCTILKLTFLDLVYIYVRTAALQIESKIAVQDLMKKIIMKMAKAKKKNMMDLIFLKINFK